MVLSLVWTLPVQKLVLLAGLTWVHHRHARVCDLFALAPEVLFALFVTALQARRPEAWKRSLTIGMITATSAFASWAVIAPWIIAGTPLSYALLKQFTSSPATFKTVMASPALWTRILLWCGAFLLLWAGTAAVRARAGKTLHTPAWLGRTPVVTLFGAVLVWSCASASQTALLHRFAILAPAWPEPFPAHTLTATLNPSAMAVLKPQARRSPGSMPPIKHVLLVVLESVRYQPGSLFDTGFPQALHFDRVYAHHPRSVKTLEAVLFGMYPSVGLLTAAWAIERYDMGKTPALPQILRDHAFAGTFYAAVDLGFDNYREVLRTAGFARIATISDGHPLTWGSGADALFSRVADTLEQGAREEQRQFIMAWTTECHMPYDFVTSARQPDDLLARYLACQDALARSLDGLLIRLDAAGVLGETAVIVLGDHGQIFSSEQAGEWGHGQHVYEQSVRIPVLVFVPDHAGGRHDRRLFQPVDIPTAVLALLAIPIPHSWVGRNMLDVSDPGRDFVVLVSGLSDGIVGVLEKSGQKYVKQTLNEPVVQYNLHRDPQERTPLPVTKDTAETVEKKLETYLNFASHAWESRREAYQTTGRSYRGDALPDHWGNGACITMTPDREQGVTMVSPVRAKDCRGTKDPFAWGLSKSLAAREVADGLSLEFEVMIPQAQEIPGGQARTVAMIWNTNLSAVQDLRFEAGVWQTVSIALPKPHSSRDAATGQQAQDIVVIVVPIDLPVRYAVRRIEVGPASLPGRNRPWDWLVRLAGYARPVPCISY
jgi:hypothetical protein